MTGDVPFVPLAGTESGDIVAVQRPWRKSIRLSSFGDALESFLARAALDRGPWLAVGFAAGIALWFVLPGPSEWLIALLACLSSAAVAGWAWRGSERRIHLLIAVVSLSAVVAGGLLVTVGVVAPLRQRLRLAESAGGPATEPGS